LKSELQCEYNGGVTGNKGSTETKYIYKVFWERRSWMRKYCSLKTSRKDGIWKK